MVGTTRTMSHPGVSVGTMRAEKRPYLLSSFSSVRAKTVVYDRSSHPEWARLVGLAMNAPVVSRPDSSRYLDVTVLIGADWRPPPLPFHP